ncbi:MAG: hypothetical protein QXN30_02945 [Metallosphaera sp.]
MTKEPTPLERLQLIIPGYRGYKTKDLIRQDDFLIRSSVKNKLELTLNKIAEVEAQIASSSPFSPELKKLETLASKIRTVIGDVASAQGGGADVSSRWKVTVKILEEIVKNDLEMVTVAEEVYNSLSSGKVEDVSLKIDQLKKIISKRQQLFFPPEYR